MMWLICVRYHWLYALGPNGPFLCLWWPNTRLSCKNDGITSQLVFVCMSFGQLLAIGPQNKERQRGSMISDKNRWYTRWPLGRWPLGRRWYRMKFNDLLQGSMIPLPWEPQRGKGQVIPLPWEPQRGKGRLYLCLENLKEARAGWQQIARGQDSMYPCVRAPPGQIIWYDWSVSDIIDFTP